MRWHNVAAMPCIPFTCKVKIPGIKNGLNQMLRAGGVSNKILLVHPPSLVLLLK